MGVESRADALEVLERVAYNGSMSFKNSDKLFLSLESLSLMITGVS